MIDIYTTHTVAQYDEPDDYHAHRILETLEMIDFVRRTSRGDLVVVCVCSRSHTHTRVDDVSESGANRMDTSMLCVTNQNNL